MAKVHGGKESFNPLNRAHEHYRQQTDGYAIPKTRMERSPSSGKSSEQHTDTHSSVITT